MTKFKINLFVLAFIILICFKFPFLFIVVAASVYIYKFKKIDNFIFFKYTLPLILLLIISIALSIPNDNPLRDKFRDIYYFIIFLSSIYIGIRLSSFIPDIRSFVILSIMFFVIGNSLYLINFILAFENFESVNKLRDYLGQSSTLISVILFPFLMSVPSFLKKIFIASTFLSFVNFSRSNIITAFFYILNINFKRRFYLIVFALVLLPFIGNITESNLSKSYFEKTKITFTELFDREFNSVDDINLRWRSYEKFIVEREFDNVFTGVLIFGKGLGASAQSDFPKRTDSTSTDYIYDIPVFHNSLLFVFLKSGYLGLFFWFIFWGLTFISIVSVGKKFVVLGYIKSQFIFVVSVFIVLIVLIYNHGYPFISKPQYISIIIGYFVALNFKINDNILNHV